MKLIKVNVLKEWIENWFTKNRFYHPYAKNNNIPITELYDILEQMPSAQPEIVRCRECKHWEYDVIFADGWCREKHQGDPNWFCADGERKESNG